MRIEKQKSVLHFVRLSAVARQLGAKSQAALTADLRTLTNHERRTVADDLTKKEG